jgi:hypothetical protein
MDATAERKYAAAQGRNLRRSGVSISGCCEVRLLRRSAIVVAGALGGLDLAAREGHGFEDTLVPHHGLHVGLSGRSFGFAV